MANSAFRVLRKVKVTWFRSENSVDGTDPLGQHEGSHYLDILMGNRCGSRVFLSQHTTVNLNPDSCHHSTVCTRTSDLLNTMANSISAKSYAELIFSMQMQLKTKGQNSAKVLTRRLSALFNPSNLSREDLDNLLRSSDIFMSQMDLTYLMRHFRSKRYLDPDETMDFKPLYALLCPELTSRRLAMIEKVWRRLDNLDQGAVPLQVLYQTYNVDNHPEVAAGLRQAQDVLSSFLDAFDAAAKGESGLITRDEFITNYKLISATFPHDENAFVKMLGCVWSVKEHDSGIVIDTGALVGQLRDKLRLRMRGAETEEQVMLRIFKFTDLRGTGTLPPGEFQQALHRLGVNATEMEVQALFSDFGLNLNDDISYMDFIDAVLGYEEHRKKKSMTQSLFSRATRRVTT